MSTITKSSIMSKVEPIKLNDKTTVYLTGKAYSVKQGDRSEGDAISVHPKQAESLIASGKATATKTTKATK